MVATVRVLIADDDDNVCQLMEAYLRKHGIAVSRAVDGKQALELMETAKPDLVVLDVMMPGMDGFGVCREIRRTSEVPILMLTARDEEADRVLGLELGADDYVTKPFSPRELAARIRAILRRVQAPQRQAEASPSIIDLPFLHVDIPAREVEASGRRLNLTPKEFDLLIFLLRHPRQVLTRERILTEIWGWGFTGDDRTVDVHVTKIRSKLGHPAQRCIQTVWSVGYKFEVMASDGE